MRYWIPQFLIDSPDFGLEKYCDDRDDTGLEPPPPACDHIDKSTYEGNFQATGQTWRDLGLSSVEMKETGLERVIVWVADQLTIWRFRGLASYHSHDDNSFERTAYLIPMLGWLYLQMAFATSLHTQYYGTKAAFGFWHGFDVMGKKGLSSTATQGSSIVRLKRL